VTASRRTAPSSDHWLDVALRYLARWDRTTTQVRAYLLHRGASPSQADRATRRLSDLKYLDDRAFAERWLDRQLNRQPMGPTRLQAELEARGVPGPLAEQVVREVLRGSNEDLLARRALAARRRTGRRLRPQDGARLLRQWGFDEEIIARIIGPGDDHE
jgi:regulatory protein